jgi:hypothetical protein
MGMKNSDSDVDLKSAGASSDAARAAAAEAEVRRLQAENAAQAERLAVVEAAAEQLAAEAPVRPLPEDEQPMYELTAPYFSADCVLYQEGTIIRDMYGNMGLNEFMVPLNEPAEIAMDAYQASLPGGGTPSLDAIIDSAYAANPDRTDDPHAKAAFHAKVLEGALLRKYQAEGRLPPGPGEKPVTQRPQRPQRLDPNTPIMGGVRIKTLQPDNMFGAASRVDHGPLPGIRRTTAQVR